MKLLSSVLPAQESYACDVEGVDADFLLLMAGVGLKGGEPPLPIFYFTYVCGYYLGNI